MIFISKRKREERRFHSRLFLFFESIQAFFKSKIQRHQVFWIQEENPVVSSKISEFRFGTSFSVESNIQRCKEKRVCFYFSHIVLILISGTLFLQRETGKSLLNETGLPTYRVHTILIIQSASPS